MHYLIEPGLWSSSPVRVAVLVGTVVAITSAVVGVFTVTRGPVVRRALARPTWPPPAAPAPS